MTEVFLFGIVLGLIPITLSGLFITAYLQYNVVISLTFD
ncbi:Cytochrome b6-f complex subunit 5 [Bienertia sinuspersici]